MRQRRRFPTTAVLCLALLVVTVDASCETPSSETIQLLEAEQADTISFKEKVSFMTPSGEEITPSIGTYRVQSVDPSALRLVPFGKKDAFVLRAQSTKHEEDIGDPVALLAIDDQYLFHIVLLLPGRRGLEAVGSSSRGRHRGVLELLTPAQIHDALMLKQAGKH